MASQSIHTGCALSRDEFAILYQSERHHDEFSYDQIMIGNTTQNQKRMKSEYNVAGFCSANIEGSNLITMSQEGKVSIFNLLDNTVHHESIIGQHGKNGMSIYGFLNSINWIDRRLFACGMGGQVYERSSSGDWKFISNKIATSDIYERWFSNIQGLSQSFLLASGLSGVLYFYNGNEWKKIKTNTEAAIGEMIFVNEKNIYIAGTDSTLLLGNIERGFKVQSVSEKGLTLYTIALFNDLIFIGTDRGLYELDPASGRMRQIDNVPKSECMSLRVADSVMWCFTNMHVFRFDGTTWDMLYEIS